MSRVGKQPVTIPNGVTVTIQEHSVSVKGPKGELKKDFHRNITIETKENQILVTRSSNTNQDKALHGLTRNIIANMVTGVTNGFERKMEIVGVGYRAQANKNKINLTLGFSHPVEYVAPKEIEFKMDEEQKNIIIIRGIDKQTVGEVAAKIRSYRKPEPYKGKGIRYFGERIVKKAGKSAAGAGGAAAK
mgnify:CR=1 FL=1